MKDDPVSVHLMQAADWYKDRYGSLLWQRNWAIIFAIGSGICLFAAVMGISALLPLKTVEPYVVMVDQGADVRVISTVNSSDEEWVELTGDEAIVQSLLVQYVIARETYSKVDLRRLFEHVRVHSERRVFDEYDIRWRDRKNGPFALYGDDTVSVEVLSVNLLNSETARVGFRTTWEKEVGQETGAYAAIVQFKFVRSAVVLDERWANPLGFLVTSYRVDQEKLEQAK